MKKDSRPWGYFKILYQKPNIWVKEIFVKPGKRTSIQSHQEREEHWFIVEGEKMKKIIIKRNEKHRIEGGSKGLRLIEVAIGSPDENDIIRYSDDYGRT